MDLPPLQDDRWDSLLRAVLVPQPLGPQPDVDQAPTPLATPFPSPVPRPVEPAQRTGEDLGSYA